VRGYECPKSASRFLDVVHRLGLLEKALASKVFEEIGESSLTAPRSFLGFPATFVGGLDLCAPKYGSNFFWRSFEFDAQTIRCFDVRLGMCNSVILLTL
jgi:hypothetical protein